MIVIGVDSHKRTHTAVAADEHGRKLGETTVAATSKGHLDLVRWAARFPDRRLALEDCRHLSRRLSADLLCAGESVIRVSPKLMAGARRSSREPGKSDPIDALAVARAALREPDLPVATLDGEERELRLLVDHREDLVAERTRAQNRLRWHLHELDPGNEPGPRSLDRGVVLAALEARLAGAPGTVARIAASSSPGSASSAARSMPWSARSRGSSALSRPRCSPCPAAARSRRPSSSARRLASGASAQPLPLPVTTGAPRSRSGPATTSATA